MTHRLDAMRSAGIIPQLASQTGDGHIHTAIQTIIINAAEQFEQMFTTHHLTGMTG
jgi:hypothetical protein